MHATRNMKKSKAEGEDNITIELFRESGEENIDILVKLVSQILKNETTPIDWENGLIIKLQKRRSEKLR